MGKVHLAVERVDPCTFILRAVKRDLHLGILLNQVNRDEKSDDTRA